MSPPEVERSVEPEAPAAEAPLGPGERLARLLLGRSPLGSLVRRVARIRASVHAKLLGAFLLTALLLIAMGAVSLQAITSVSRQSRLLDQARERVDTARQVEQTLGVQMSATRNALLLRDDGTIESILRERERVDETLVRLEAAAPPAERDTIERIRAIQGQVMATVGRLAGLIREGQHDEAMALHLGEGAPLHREMATLVTRVFQMEEVGMLRLRQDVEAANRRALLLMGGFAAASILLALVLGFVTSWSFILPVRQAEAFLGQVAKGDFAATIDVPNRDEFATLAGQMNRMSRELHQLYAEVEARNRELTEALDQQTATAEILRAISSSPADLQPVLETVARAAARFCRAPDVAIMRLDGPVLRSAAAVGSFREVLVGRLGSIDALAVPLTRGSVTGRAIVDRCTVHVRDLAAEPEGEFPEGRELQRRFGHRSMVATPLLREGAPLGAIALFRMEVVPFSDKQLDLLRLFADQAVIAIENLRLFTELQARNRALTESLEQQTATAEILRVISGSPTDVQPVFNTIVRSAAQLCQAHFGAVARLEDGVLHLVALSSLSAEEATAFHGLFPRPTGRNFVMGRAVVDGQAVHFEDVLAEIDYDARTRETLQRTLGYRTFLGVPILRDGVPIGAIGCGRREVRPFTPTQIELLKTFADQAVIAIENVRLFQELQQKNLALTEAHARVTEALDQQTATSEVLKVISRSAFDLQPVLETLIESAVRLCGADKGFIYRQDGNLYHAVVAHGASAEFMEVVKRYPIRPDRGSATGRAVLERRAVHIDDVLADPEYRWAERRLTGEVRTILAVPMLREDAVLGVIVIRRTQVEPFTDKQVELVRTFADQAVIAIENVRLFRGLEARNRALSESLEQQTATGEILRVISQSPTDIQPIFDTIGERARRLTGADISVISWFDGQLLQLVELHGVVEEGSDAVQRAFPMRPDAETVTARTFRSRAVVHVADVLADPDYEQQDAARSGRYRGCLGVPMLREGQVVGVIFVARERPGLFSDTQVDLLKTFADQAVIAIENVRLFQELETRNRDLSESLEQQTATGEILRVISSSPTDTQPVFDTIARSAVRLCRAAFAYVFRYDGTLMHVVAHHNLSSAALEALDRQWPMRPNRGSVPARAILDRGVIHVMDVLDEPDYPYRSTSEALGIRTMLTVPMLREGQPIGAIAVYRQEVAPFSDQQIGLVTTFADQAVIAIENVRLFKELEAKNRDLTETLEQQTATSEILRVISSSPTDIRPVLDAVAENAARLCEAHDAQIFRVEGDLLRPAASFGPIPAPPARPIGRGWVTGRAVVDRRTVHVHDLAAESEEEFPVGRETQRLFGHRTTLATPLLREGQPLGAILIRRMEVRPFSEKQIKLLETFADQAAIAIENAQLLNALQERTAQLTRSVDELRALGEVTQAVGSSLDLETVLATIVRHAMQLSGSHGGIVYEFEEATGTFQVRTTLGVAPDHVEALRATPIRLGEGAVGRAGVIRTPVEVADIAGHGELVAPQARGLLIRDGVGSLLAVPLVRDERLLGGFVILRREAGAFPPEVVASLQTFATQSVLAIHNARLFREIQRQKDYADALVETSPVAIVTMKLDGTVVSWNPGAERLFGHAAAEALGHAMEDLVATPETREEIRANVRRTVGGESIRAIARRARKDGTPVDVEISSMPVMVDGARVGMIAIYHDITELLRARREAEAANEAKSAFLATMSHEIRTPMNAVIGMSGLLLGTPLTDEQREYAEVVRQSGDALLTVINDILDFSKIEAGKLELEAQPFDVRECVEGALDLVAARAAEKGLDLAYLIAEETPAAVVGDVTRLRQILLNLLSNAVKFTERGEIVLSVSARRLDGAPPRHELTFAVRDTGIGIPPDRLGRLFQSFSQVDASTTRRYGGTGLGLAISQRLTELMGGRIAVTSEVGSGSEFRFTIRAAAAEAPLSTRRDLGGIQPSLRGKRVLVVDDNATNRRILAAHLDAWGMAGRATASPREALDWVRAGERFDVGVLDMHMPEMDGVVLARAIREHPAGTTLPLVLFTSLGRREARAEEEGFAAYLHKPIKPSQLFDTLVSVLGAEPVHVRERGVARTELDPAMAARHPLRILLAEDNVVNQKVALRILGQMGYRADVAANGLEAVAAVGRQTYDVVLMDVQMPELDGFEASREINRRWPGERRPWIVAMTANAMQGDRELCQAAGMDDYVAKPIRVEELVAALERCRPRADAGATVTPATAAIDRTTFDRLAATMGGSFVAELIDTFLEDGLELIGSLRRALAEMDVDVLRRAAHSLKSNAETLGATRLAALARELEGMARARRSDGAAARIDQLRETYDLVARALGELRRGLPA
jgi:PAS domain S-box-containing protein